ncbi:MAG: AraC family transcriptional regulator [Kofleriaceae bacterium]
MTPGPRSSPFDASATVDADVSSQNLATSSVALAGCTVERVAQGLVEVAQAPPAHRSFPPRITQRFGVCWKSGPDHAVLADGRELRFPDDTICVRPAGCVWGTEGTGPVAFFSLDLDPSLLPARPRAAAMTFIPAGVLDFRRHARVLRSASAATAAEIVCELVLALEHAGAFTAEELRERAPERTARGARDVIDARLHDPPSIVELAALLDTSRFALARAFRRAYGISPRAYIMQLRIERARDRLARGQEIIRVAGELGFADQAHFTRAFGKTLGMPPGAYARQVRAHSFKPAAR